MPKLDLNRVKMPRQEPKVRAKNFNEVALGYSAEQAQAEANRCIQCPKRACVAGCPVEIDIPGFIQAICDSDMPKRCKYSRVRTPCLVSVGGSVLRKHNVKKHAL